MSVLDVFYILFKSKGTDDVKKSEEELKRSGDNLNQSMKESSSTAEKMGISFEGMGRQLARAATAALSVGSIIHGIKSAINYASDLDLASQMLDVNIEDLDAWGNAVQRTGGTAQEFQASLRALSRQMGISGQTALQVLPQLADSFQKMGRFASIKYGGETLHLDEHTILLLQKGRREVEDIIKQQKELGVVSAENSERARKFNYEWSDATHSLRTNFLKLSDELLPILTEITKAASVSFGYLSEHPDVLKAGLLSVGGFALLARKGILKLGSAILKTKAVARGLGGILAGVAYEDIDYFIKGYDSYIGRLMKQFPILQRYAEAFLRTNREINSALSWVYKEGKAGYEKIFGKKDESNVSKTPGEDFKKQIGSGLTISLNDYEKLKNTKLLPLKNALDITTNSSIAYTNPASLARLPTPSGNKSVVVNSGPTTINTQATDAQGTAKAFTDHLEDQITQVNNYFDDGVKI